MVTPKREENVMYEREQERKRVRRETSALLLSGMLSSETIDFTYVTETAVKRAVHLTNCLLKELENE